GPKTSIICSPMTSLKTSIKTITYLSDIGCLEIQGASLASKKGFLPLLLGGMLSVAGRVRHIICTDFSRQWKLRDVSSRLYMSESQLKKKLKEEGCSFTGVLLDVRMGYARRLLQARLPVNRVAAQCGYVSTSYFICVFRECFGVTPHRMLALQEHGQHKSEC
ncbi:helix-turn-helix domain-containing protein, partial [Escherichia coli]|nr:helix-turn-helix domain-containing protein [Escherichia coli]MED8638055.1 helix-turn-helix domain-containing protein [Escherichia coli]